MSASTSSYSDRYMVSSDSDESDDSSAAGDSDSSDASQSSHAGDDDFDWDRYDISDEPDVLFLGNEDDRPDGCPPGYEAGYAVAFARRYGVEASGSASSAAYYAERYGVGSSDGGSSSAAAYEARYGVGPARASSSDGAAARPAAKQAAGIKTKKRVKLGAKVAKSGVEAGAFAARADRDRARGKKPSGAVQQEIQARAAKGAVKMALSAGSAAGHAVIVAGVVVKVISVAFTVRSMSKTMAHISRLRAILVKIGDSKAKDPVREAIMFAIRQKRQKLTKKGFSLLPLVGTAFSIYGIFRNLYKRFKGTLGQAREKFAKDLWSAAKAGKEHAIAACRELLGSTYDRLQDRRGLLDDGWEVLTLKMRSL